MKGFESCLKQLVGLVEQLGRKIWGVGGMLKVFVFWVRAGVHFLAWWWGFLSIDLSSSFILHSIWRTRVPRV